MPVKQARSSIQIPPAQIVLARPLREIARVADTLRATGVGLRMLRTRCNDSRHAGGPAAGPGVRDVPRVADTLLRARGPGRRRRVRRTALACNAPRRMKAVFRLPSICRKNHFEKPCSGRVVRAGV
jgi:hypothetical protein